MDGTTIPEKDFDIVLYGATGFVGSRAAEYLAKHPQQERLRWAIAGLDRNKLEQVKQHLGATATSVSVLVTDSRDRDAVAADCLCPCRLALQGVYNTQSKMDKGD